MPEDQYRTFIQSQIKISLLINDSVASDEDTLSIEKSFVNISYTCEFNNCNDEATESKIIPVIEDHSNFSSVYEALRRKYHEDQSRESSTTSISDLLPNEAYKPSSSSVKQTTSERSMLHIISMNGLILQILFLMFF